MNHGTNEYKKGEKRVRNHWIKRKIAYVLTLCMVAGLLVGIPPMEVKAASGTTDNISWDLTNGTLTISGSGDMPSFGYKGQPWYDYNENITKVVIKEGITKVGDNAFTPYHTNIRSVELPYYEYWFTSISRKKHNNYYPSGRAYKYWSSSISKYKIRNYYLAGKS